MPDCFGCGLTYKLRPSKSIYCSISCANKARLGKTKFTMEPCSHCGESFLKKKSKYCSTQCSNRSRTGRKNPHTDAYREYARDRINKRYAAGWLPKAGRCKKFEYSSPIAGNIQVDGTWELSIAKYFDSKKYNWRRNTERFPYVCPKGKNRFYTPDFWVEEIDGFVEVKGYETELDRFKWKSFPHKLTVLKKDFINKITVTEHHLPWER